MSEPNLGVKGFIPLGVKRFLLRQMHALRAMRNWKDFSTVHTFCLFIGYPRSGHSLVGSLIDAHHNAVIARELNIISRMTIGSFGRAASFGLILERAREAEAQGQEARYYNYRVPDQWQGRYDTLRVIGAKRGEATALFFGQHPEFLQQLTDIVQCEVKFIHVTRNPFDNIATIAKRWRQYGDSRTLTDAIEFYFTRADGVQTLKQLPGALCFDVRHEAVISDPHTTLRGTCKFLNLPVTEDYLDACAGILYKSPNQTRHDASWTPELIDAVQARILTYDFLAHYTYKSD